MKISDIILLFKDGGKDLSFCNYDKIPYFFMSEFKDKYNYY
jgi:hypothetical protein